MKRVLIIDDEESICWGLSQLCSQLSLESETAASAEKGLEIASGTQFDLMIMDVRLPGMDGITAIDQFQQVLGNIPIITMTAFGDLQTAIGAIQNGAYEYIVKPFELDEVRQKIQQALAASNLSGAKLVAEAGDELNERSGLIGSSSLMQEVFKQVALTTTSKSPVLITGESGTGKELTARSIHKFGTCSDGPFIAVNIAALSPTIIESELFGHVKGAFTGAQSDRIGLIQKADGGTLFLDEVAEIPLDIQVKLLRVLDLNEVTPVGSIDSIKTNFRLISATNQDLLSQINHGEFRHDLYYRLRTFEIKLPPLRQRREDIPELVRHFLRGIETSTGVNVQPTESFLERLQSQNWPGNIRELQSVVDRAATMARGGVVTSDHIQDQAELRTNDSGAATDVTQQIHQWIDQWTRQNWSRSEIDNLYDALIAIVDPAILAAAYELSDQQYSTAARRLGIHRTTLKKKLDEFDSGDNQ